MNRGCTIESLIDDIRRVLGLTGVFAANPVSFFLEHVAMQTSPEDWETWLGTLTSLGLNFTGRVIQYRDGKPCAIFQRCPAGGALFLEFTRNPSHLGFCFPRREAFDACKGKLGHGVGLFTRLPDWDINTPDCQAFACMHARSRNIVQFVCRAVPLADQITEPPGE